MDMPKPGDAHKRLAGLIGEWAGAETVHPSPWDPAGGTAEARVSNRWIADGFAVAQDYQQSRRGQVTFRGHGVFWYDPRKQEYVMHWWDSMGGTAGEYRGQFSGDVLTLGAPMPQGGQARTSWAPTGPNSHTFLMEVSMDGQTWHPAMEGRYKKGGAKKAAAGRPAAKRRATARTSKAAARKGVKRTAKKAGKKARRR